jgi:arylsulfatase A-like enzyme
MPISCIKMQLHGFFSCGKRCPKIKQVFSGLQHLGNFPQHLKHIFPYIHQAMKSPNILYVFADQWRAQAFGYAGDTNAKTPNIDAFAAQSVNCHQALSGIPVCCPARATLISGKRPLTHGVFVNDVCLDPSHVSIGERFRSAGYATAYIGKLHIDGHGRKSYIPPERHRGFEHWQVCECTHDYNQSIYYQGDSEEPRYWPGYDAFSQTDAACDYIRSRSAVKSEQPFFMMLSWGPPHDPYDTAPEDERKQFDPQTIKLRPNVPDKESAHARKILAGYYAHAAALDKAFGQLLETLRQTHLENDTIVIFTSDHGDMLGSQGQLKKQRPWDESIRIPLLIRWPNGLGQASRRCDALIDVVDHQPTLLELCGIPLDPSLQGQSFAKALRGDEDATQQDAVLLTCPHPAGEYRRELGGREYRGLRTQRYTYVESLQGAWLLYDNLEDPYQLNNLCGNPTAADIQQQLAKKLEQVLVAQNDSFEKGETYCAQWGYKLDATGTVPYFD